MNIDDLTLGQVKSLVGMLDNKGCSSSLNGMIGEKVIIRTNSAGVWFGHLFQKSGEEVIIQQARQLYKWHAIKGISLSEISIHGVNESESKLTEPVTSIWLVAIEIIPCEKAAIESISGASNATP